MDNILKLLALIFLIGLVILLYTIFNKPKVYKIYYDLVPGILKMSQSYENTFFISNIIKDRSSIIAPGYGYGLTITWSMNIPNTVGEQFWNSSFNKDKPIIRIGESPQIYYNPKYNVLKVIVKYKESPFYAHYPIIELKNIPLQRWNHYAVVIFNNNIKIYLNKILMINTKLPNIPEILNSDIIVGQQNNNIIGQIRNLRCYFRPFDNEKIKSIM